MVGAALRLELAGQSLLSDELATYWEVSTMGFRDLVSTIHSDAEISPPLSFVLSWLALQAESTPAWVRAPSLVAGVITIPTVYLIGERVSGRAAGLTAAGLTTFAPFMVFYSAEARGYAVAIALLALSTLAMLVALDDRRRRWWAGYAVASCAAAYSHYTCVFVLAAQFLWIVWAYPEARRAALLANVAAAVAYVPWLSGLQADLDSPTTDILSALQPFSLEAVGTSLVHWSVGYPYAILVPPEAVPGKPALAMLALGLVTALVAVVVRGRRSTGPGLAASKRGAVLMLTLALATPVGAAIMSAVGSNLFSTRNLAASWPGLALAAALLLVSAGPRLRILTAGLAVAALAIGAVKLLDDSRQRPPYEDMAAFINARSEPGDVVIDETAVISPGPLSSLDPYLERRGPVLRSLQPQQRVRPFSVEDRVVPMGEAARKAVDRARGGRIFLATDAGRAKLERPLRGYRLVSARRWPGIFDIEVRVFTPAS